MARLFLGLDSSTQSLSAVVIDLVTDEKAKAWMNAAVLAIRAALVSCSPISASETSTTAGGRSRTFLSVLPADDRWTCLAEERNTGELCAAGDEGAVVEVRMLT